MRLEHEGIDVVAVITPTVVHQPNRDLRSGRQRQLCFHFHPILPAAGRRYGNGPSQVDTIRLQMERSTCGLRGHAGPDGVNASTFHIGGELQPFHGFDPTHVVAATIHASDVNTLVGPQRTTIVCVICIPEAHTLSAAIEMLGFDGAGNRVVGECSWGFPLPDPNPIHFEGRGERRGSIGVTRPIAAHREVQNEMEVPVKRCFSIPGRCH